MSFSPDEDLLSRARKLSRKIGQSYDGVRALLEEYNIAIKLANGPVPERSAEWAEKTLVTQDQLRKVVGWLEDNKPRDKSKKKQSDNKDSGDDDFQPGHSHLE